MRKMLVVLILVGVGFEFWALYRPSAPVHAQGGGIAWQCSLDDIGATLTRCAVGNSSTRLYLTDVVIQSTTATAGLYLIRYGTGANCGTGTTSLLPSAAAVPRLAYPANTLTTHGINLQTPVSAPPGNDICIICAVTNTCTVHMNGYAAP